MNDRNHPKKAVTKLEGNRWRSGVRASKCSFSKPVLDAIDRAEDQIERGEVHDWKAVREQVRAKFLGN